MEEINFKEIEKKWQDEWKNKKAFLAKDDSNKEKYYCLEMFPYPSGDGLHMGHAWNYTIGDIIARFKRMKGFNVLHPMGYDSLGLPAENAAIKAGTHPEDYNRNSIKNFTKQLNELGISYDWSRTLSTDNPEYYKWDQWIFLKLFERGLAYKKESAVNWCSKCNTVLANEQVHEGHCWRHDEVDVSIKHLNQWFFKITDYANELYEGLDELKEWPERTKTMQRNWIGKSHGTEINFKINNEVWPVFTTRADTIYGVTFVVISAAHSKLNDLVTEEQRESVNKFLKTVKSVSEKEMGDIEKEGVFTGSYAINPINGEKIPVYAGNFVVADYGSGMVMAVPAHDKRDYDFAKKYKIKIKEVIKSNSLPNTEYGKLINSGEFSGLNSSEAKEKVTNYLESKELGKKVTNFRLRDWGISRQRYWGVPIPIINCPDCGSVTVPESDLPVKLPHNVKFGEGNPLLTNEDWINVPCPKCSKMGRRETDTMDTFVNSSWYFLRYCDNKNDKNIFDSKKVNSWCPVDTYVGGAEHACMHLIYARFYTKFLRDLGLVNFSEPFTRLFHQGMLHAEDGQKMSKSKNNGVLPEEVSNKYGIDTARFFLSSLASPDKDIDWNEKGIIGSLRFVKKIFDYVNNSNFSENSEELDIKLNLTIKNCEKYYDNFEYRKATIELRGLFDLIEKGSSKESINKFLKLLNPICPHITEELWERLGNKELISLSSWPEYDKTKLETKNKEIDLNEKIITLAKATISKLEEGGKKIKKVYVYIVPFEVEKINLEKISEALGKEVIVYSVSDSSKYDPENKSKRARPGLPGLYFE